MADKASTEAARQRTDPSCMAAKLRHHLHPIKSIHRRFVEMNIQCLQWPTPKRVRKVRATLRTQAERLKDLIDESDHPSINYDPLRRKWSCGLYLSTATLYALLRRTMRCRDSLLDQVYEDHRRDLPTPLFRSGSTSGSARIDRTRNLSSVSRPRSNSGSSTRSQIRTSTRDSRRGG